jgi:uncharacterized protein with GYD domain
MAMYLILSCCSRNSFGDAKEFSAEDVSSKIEKECSGVRWKESFATLGRFDAVDVVEAHDQREIEKAAMIIGAYRHSTTEIVVATPWTEFLGML